MATYSSKNSKLAEQTMHRTRWMSPWSWTFLVRFLSIVTPLPAVRLLIGGGPEDDDRLEDVDADDACDGKGSEHDESEGLPSVIGGIDAREDAPEDVVVEAADAGDSS
jgi:hypothetical protein